MKNRVHSRKSLTNRRYLWSIFLVVLAIDLIITTLLFSLYSSTQISKAKDYSLSQLEQACTITDLLYTSMNSVANQILQDTSTRACLRNSDIDRLKEAQACTKLRDIQTAYPYMRYISFYNSDSKRFLSSSYAGYLLQPEIDTYYNALGERSSTCVFGKIGSDYVAQKAKLATGYTFIFKINTRPGSTADLILVDVDEEYFSSIFNSLRHADSEQEIVLLDATGKIITSQLAEKNDTAFTQMSGNTKFNPIYITDQADIMGAMTYNFPDFPNRFLSYYKAHSSGLTIVNLVPYTTILSGLFQIALLTLALSIVTLGFGYMLSRKMSRILYAPIQTLYDSYVKRDASQTGGNELEQLSIAFSEMYSKADSLEQGMISTYTDSRKLYLDYLLKGRIQDVRHPEAVYERLDIDISSPFYTVIVIHCVPMEDTTPQSEADVFLSYYALENVTREIASRYGKNDLLRTGENSFAVLLSLNEERLPEQLAQSLDTVSAVMLREFKTETTICIGRVTNSFQNINMCYESTIISLNASTYKNHGTTFTADATAAPITAGQYYNKLHSKLSDFVRNEDLPSCSEEFDLALSSMDNISFQTAKTYFNHVMMSILDEFASSFDQGDESFSELMKSLDEMMTVQNVRTMKKVLIAFLSLLMHRIALNKKSGNQDTANIAKEYIDKNFANPDLSSRMLADLVGLSPAYFGKIFTAITTFTFNDYLNNTRMKKATELLVKTKLSVGQISENVGILNTNYFYSVFKKRYNMTPSDYRKESKKADE